MPNQILKDISPETHADFSSTSYERLRECSYSLSLAGQIPPRPSSEAAELGTFKHLVMANWIESLEDCDLPAGKLLDPCVYEGVSDGTFTIEGEHFEDIQKAADGFAELLEFLKFDELPILFTEKQFRHSAAGFGQKRPSVAGTADVFFFGVNSEDVRICGVVDFKFGQHPVQAKDNKQLQFLLGCAWEDYSRLDDDFINTFVREADFLVGAVIQPSNPQRICGHGYVSAEIYSTDEVEGFASEIDRVVCAYQSNKNPEPVMGDHCKYCPVNAICKAQQENAQKLLEVPMPEWTFDPDELGAALIRAEQAVEHAKHLKETCHTLLKEGHDITGWTMKPGRRARYWGDEELAAKKLTELGVNQVHEIKIITPAKAEKALKAIGQATSVIDQYIETRPPGLVMARVKDTAAEKGALPKTTSQQGEK